MNLDEGSSFKDFRKFIEDFVNKRGPDWIENNSSPRSQLLSAFIELGEVAEKFQWKDHYWKPETEEEKKEVAYEMVDVINYLMMFMNITGIDFEKAYLEKMEKMEDKFPVGQDFEKEYQKAKEDYRKSGKNRLYE